MESNGNGKIVRPTPLKMSHNYSVSSTAFLATSVPHPFVSSTDPPGGSQLAINYPFLIDNKEHNEKNFFVCQPLQVEKRGTTSDIRPFERISPDSASLAKQPRLDVDQTPPNSACTDPAHSTAFTVFTGRHSDSWVINMIFSIVLPSTRIELIFYDYSIKVYNGRMHSGGMNGSPQTPAEHPQYPTDLLAVYRQNSELWRMLYERSEVIANLAQQLANSKEREMKYLRAPNAYGEYISLSNYTFYLFVIDNYYYYCL